MQSKIEPAPIPPKPAVAAHVIKDDAEAISIAQRLAAAFVVGSAERDRGRLLPFAELDLYSQSGLWAMNVPAAYGGAGVSYATVAEVFKIISAADASIGQIAQNHISLIDIIRLDDDETRKRFFFGEVLRGVRFGNATSERGGKTILDFKTKLTRKGDGFVVNGEKFYSTGALLAHMIPVNAINEDGKSTFAIVERDAPGLSVIDDWNGIGQKTTASGTVRLDNVFVPASHVVPSHLAFDTPSLHGPVAQILQAAIDAGIAQHAIEDTLAFVRTRTRPWVDSGQDRVCDDHYLLREIADLQIRFHAAEAVLERAGFAIDAGLRDENAETVAEASIRVAEAKVLTTEIALLATNKLFELAGTQSTLEAHNLDRHWRDARTHTLHDPVRWKFHAIGNYSLNGIKPPRHSWI